MNVFQTHAGIIDDYATYIRSFLNIADPTIREVVEGELSKGKLWPEPLLQFNPSFEIVGTCDGSGAAQASYIPISPIFSRATRCIGIRSKPSSWALPARTSSSRLARGPASH